METPHLYYQPLKSNEIRLIKFDENLLRSNKFSGELDYVNVEDDPIFFALSYVWGDSTQTKPVIINGQSVEVTENLHDALRFMG
jgi:hypothetical protein